MRAVIQRVRSSSVSVEGQVVGRIGEGLNVLVAVARDDTEKQARWLAKKTVNLRLFPDGQGAGFARSLLETQGELLVISQFTLYGNCKKGRRPSFIHSAPSQAGRVLYECYVEALKQYGLVVETGQFGAMMDVKIHNWGPVTLIVDSPLMSD